MNTLREEILKYAGVIEENATVEQIGRSICRLKEKGYSDKEIIRNIGNIAKDWVNITVFNDKKIVKVNINPMDWDGTNIADAVSREAPNRELARRIIQNWAEDLIDGIKAKYKGYTLDIPDRSILKAASV